MGLLNLVTSFFANRFKTKSYHRKGCQVRIICIGEVREPDLIHTVISQSINQSLYSRAYQKALPYKLEIKQVNKSITILHKKKKEIKK
jgi:hypothetical protein